MATHEEPTCLITRKDVVLVKPSQPTPSNVLLFSTIDNDPNLEIMCQTLYVYQANCTRSYINGNKNQDHMIKVPTHSDPVLVLKDALSRALVYYYPLAGKLMRQSTDGRLRITCNGEGVPFLEASSKCELSSFHYFDGIDVKTGQQFVFDWPSEIEDGYHPLVLQVTKFVCGGFTIGMGLSHSVCDGFGAAQFFRAIAELASGRKEPTVKPVWERERLIGKSSPVPIQLVNKAAFATSPFLPATNVSHRCFNIDAETIRKLKMHLTEETGKDVLYENFTTLEVLAAYVWRSRFRALQQNYDGTTIFGLAVGIRHLMDPPLPAGYYGNAFVSANVVVLGGELDEGPLSNVANLIKKSKKVASKKEQILNSLNVLETLWKENMKIESNGASFVLTDWRQLRLLEEIDFGWKASVNMIPLPWNMFGYVNLCIILPPCRVNTEMEGGVRILVSFPEAAMARFEQEIDALKRDNYCPKI